MLTEDFSCRYLKTIIFLHRCICSLLSESTGTGLAADIAEGNKDQNDKLAAEQQCGFEVRDDHRLAESVVRPDSDG